MIKKTVLLSSLVIALCILAAGVTQATDEPARKDGLGNKTKNFIQKLFSYPAEVLQGSVDVVADTGKRGTRVVTEEVKTVGQVVTGDFEKTGELVTEPLTGTAETVVKAVEETVAIPAEAAKEE